MNKFNPRKARTLTAAMKRALAANMTVPAPIHLPEDDHIDARLGDSLRPFYDKQVRYNRTMKVRGKCTNPRLGCPGTATRTKLGFSGGVGRQPK